MRRKDTSYTSNIYSVFELTSFSKQSSKIIEMCPFMLVYRQTHKQCLKNIKNVYKINPSVITLTIFLSMVSKNIEFLTIYLLLYSSESVRTIVIRLSNNWCNVQMHLFVFRSFKFSTRSETFEYTLIRLVHFYIDISLLFMVYAIRSRTEITRSLEFGARFGHCMPINPFIVNLRPDFFNRPRSFGSVLMY